VVIEQHALAYSYLAGVLHDVGETSQARESYLKALELDDKMPAPYVGLGLLLVEKGDYVTAEVQFRKAISVDPHYARAYSYLAEVLGKLGRTGEAKEGYLKAVELGAKSPVPHL
jgi:Tfp pilus assembly protein PilF